MPEPHLKSLIALLALLTTAVPAFGQFEFSDDALSYDRDQPFVGYWLGTADTESAGMLVASLEILPGNDGVLTATMRSLLMLGPGQEPTSPVVIDGDHAECTFDIGASVIRVEVELDDTRQRLDGSWAIVDADGPFDLRLQRWRRTMFCAAPKAFVGTINVQNVMELDMTIVVAQAESGRWVGHVDIPAQSTTEYPLVNLAEEAGVITAVIPGPMPATLTLDISDDASRLTGTMVQAGMTFDIDFERERAYEPASLKRPQTPEAPFPYETREVKIDHPDGHTLAGTVCIPEGEGPFPCAVFITGSGPQDRDETLMGHRPFLVIADHFARHGIISLRCDDRGTGRSTGDFSAAASPDFARDAMAQVDWMLERADEMRIDIERIGLVGHSEGGLIAPMLAAERDDLGFIILMAGPGVSGREILPLQGRLLYEANGMSPDVAAQASEQNARLLDIVMRDDLDEQSKRARMREIMASSPVLIGLEEPTDEQIDDAVETFWTTMSSPWMRYFVEYDPRMNLQNVRCPVLAINGTLDLQVWHAQNLPVILETVRAGGGEIDIIRYEGLNHLFQLATTGSIAEYARIETTIEPLVLHDMTAWIHGLDD